MKENVLKAKSYLFAIDIVKLCRDLTKSYKEYVLINQLLKSGTSIGANIREAEFSQSKADFISKMSIALKEESETEYWLNLLKDTDYLADKKFVHLLEKSTELIRMLVSTVKTSKK